MAPEDTISVTLLLFASLREEGGRCCTLRGPTPLLTSASRPAAGTGRLEVPLAQGATTKALVAHVESEYPRLATILPSCAVSVNRAYADDQVRDPRPQLSHSASRFLPAVVGAQTVLKDGDEVALIPPVSGG